MELKREVIGKQPGPIAASLKKLVADEYVLSVRTRNAYRYIYGSNVGELRKLFESQYESLDVIVDDVTRKVHALGEIVMATFVHSMEVTRLRRHNEKFRAQSQILEALLDDHQSIIHSLRREGSGDTAAGDDTADFMTELQGQHERMAVALRDWLQ